MARLRTPLALLAALLAAACGGGSGGGTDPTVVVMTAPADTSVQPGGLLKFTVRVTGASDATVTWSVDEPGGGTIDASGFYTAPSAEGTYHVRAVHVAHGASATGPAGASLAIAEAAVSAKKGGGTSVVHVTKGGAAQQIAVGVSPATASVPAGGSARFTATVTGTANTSVAWAIQEGPACGTVTASGAYTAPGAAASCHVVATSAADGSTSAAAAVTVADAPVVAVALSPASPAVDACQSLTFTATVTGTSNTAVTWSVVEGSAGGTISAGGVYTAPPAAGTYHVMATSAADPTKAAALAVPVSTRILSVAVSPATLTVPAAGTAQLTTTVTTTCGASTSVRTVDSTGAVTASN